MNEDIRTGYNLANTTREETGASQVVLKAWERLAYTKKRPRVIRFKYGSELIYYAGAIKIGPKDLIAKKAGFIWCSVKVIRGFFAEPEEILEWRTTTVPIWNTICKSMAEKFPETIIIEGSAKWPR